MARSRYDTTGERKDSNGNRIKKSIIYPSIPSNDTEDAIIDIEETERLDKLANEYYGDTELWWVIAEVNNLGRGTLYVDPGQRIRIPMDISKVFSRLENVNENR